MTNRNLHFTAKILEPKALIEMFNITLSNVAEDLKDSPAEIGHTILPLEKRPYIQEIAKVVAAKFGVVAHWGPKLPKGQCPLVFAGFSTAAVVAARQTREFFRTINSVAHRENRQQANMGKPYGSTFITARRNQLGVELLDKIGNLTPLPAANAEKVERYIAEKLPVLSACAAKEAARVARTSRTPLVMMTQEEYEKQQTAKVAELSAFLGAPPETKSVEPAQLVEPVQKPTTGTTAIEKYVEDKLKVLGEYANQQRAAIEEYANQQRAAVEKYVDDELANLKTLEESLQIGNKLGDDEDGNIGLKNNAFTAE